ncbi:hypothetical protein LJR029_003884 [Caballeronia sp. LjRoot29]|uniref:hypothetical protein n=1 Tax=Caballeronia sp. LjRoot29 TaxID=3342315 RepID=UPI003ED00276
MKQSLDGRTVFITGANGGLGEQFVEQALQRGVGQIKCVTDGASKYRADAPLK